MFLHQALACFVVEYCEIGELSSDQDKTQQYFRELFCYYNLILTVSWCEHHIYKEVNHNKLDALWTLKFYFSLFASVIHWQKRLQLSGLQMVTSNLLAVEILGQFKPLFVSFACLYSVSVKFLSIETVLTFHPTCINFTRENRNTFAEKLATKWLHSLYFILFDFLQVVWNV